MATLYGIHKTLELVTETIGGQVSITKSKTIFVLAVGPKYLNIIHIDYCNYSQCKKVHGGLVGNGRRLKTIMKLAVMKSRSAKEISGKQL